jgi:hypothetical protein
MKLRRPLGARPCLEELEGRLVPSAVASTSTNWSGYAVTAGRGAVTAVSGSWVVPTVSGSGTAYSSDWVGIDGFSSPTVEQIGTDSDLAGGTPQYYAWYEMYPSGSVQIPLAVHAGDTMSASVTYGSNGFTLSISDVTTGKSFTTTKAAAGAQRSSAEWVVEAPSSYSGILPLANFGKVTFTGAQATVGGTTGAIDSFTASGERVYAINMVSPRTGATEDTTSGLTDSGSSATSSFTVTDTGTQSNPTPPHHGRWWFGPDQTAAVQAASSVAAALSAGGGSSSAAPAASQRLAAPAQVSGALAPAASFSPAALAGARLSGDVGRATGGQAEQPGEPVTAPDDAGPRGTAPAQSTEPGATPAPSTPRAIVPASDAAAPGGPEAPSAEDAWEPAARVDVGGGADDAPNPAEGLLLALMAGVSLPAFRAREERRRGVTQY